jgi:rRNA-processing protein FCF1
MSVLVDTDALIAVANTSLWDEVTRVEMVTTNVCKKELERHAEGRDDYLREGAEAVLDEIETDDSNIDVVTSVPRPHGKDAGEASIAREVAGSDEFGTVAMMDADGREKVRRRADGVSVYSPAYLFYILLDNGIVSRTEFCEACAEMLRNEGWTGYMAVKSAWEGIPVDCSDVIDDELLPDGGAV